MEKLVVKEAIVVEGKYDKNTLAQVVDCLIFVTHGFGIFSNPQQMNLLRQVAQERGLIVLTDGDGAGFVIRNRIASSIDKSYLKHAYIPDILGKEKRKSQSSKEGKLGVEGMSPQLLRQILEKSGAEILGTGAENLVKDSGSLTNEPPIDNGDFLQWGLTGEGSAQRREALLAYLGLPAQMSKKAMLALFSSQYGREEVEWMLKESREV